MFERRIETEDGEWGLWFVISKQTLDEEVLSVATPEQIGHFSLALGYPGGILEFVSHAYKTKRQYRYVLR